MINIDNEKYLGLYNREIKIQKIKSAKLIEKININMIFRAGAIYSFIKDYNLEQSLNTSLALIYAKNSEKEKSFPTEIELKNYIYDEGFNK